MAVVKIYLDPHESEAEAKALLIKALTAQDTGAVHTEDFSQPAAQAVLDRMLTAHEDMWQVMLREIAAVLDEEVG